MEKTIVFVLTLCVFTAGSPINPIEGMEMSLYSEKHVILQMNLKLNRLSTNSNIK